MADRVSSIRDQQIDHSAEWGNTFIDNSTGSQRRQYADDIAEASQRHKQRQDEEFQALQLRRPEVGKLVIAREKEDREARNQILQRDLNERKFQWQTEKEALANQINGLRAEREMAQEKRLLNQALLAEKTQLRRDEQTANVQSYIDGMLEKGVMPGTKEYAYGAAEVLKQNPYIENTFRKLIMDDARIIQDPAEAQARLARGDTVVETTDSEGNPKFTFTAKPPKEESNLEHYKNREYYSRERDKYLKMLPSNPKDPKFAEINQRAKEYDRLANDADMKIRGQVGATATSNSSSKPSNFTNPEEYTKAFQAAPSGTVLMYNGKPYKKP